MVEQTAGSGCLMRLKITAQCLILSLVSKCKSGMRRHSFVGPKEMIDKDFVYGRNQTCFWSTDRKYHPGDTRKISPVKDRFRWA